MDKKQILVLALCLLSICTISRGQDQDCFPRLIRLLIGDKYADINSPFTATLMYQTFKECNKSGIVFRGQAYQTTGVSSFHSVWNNTFCHNKKQCEQVIYDQYIHTIKVAVDPQTDFTYAFCANKDSQTGCTADFTSRMPPIAQTIQKALRSSFLSKKAPLNSGPMKILFFGDHDLSDAGQITLKALYKTLETTKFDAFIFLGDYGYEFYQNNGQVGDDYIDALTKINTAAPMAITAGNHEDNFNFQFFNEKFQMPYYTQTQNNYYSFDLGNTHFVGLNLHYFNDQKTTPNPENQQKMLDWVENDLKNVDRNVTPWIIVFGHKMIYCKGSDCMDFANDYAAFDTILNKYQVDLFISGHKHKFQAMKPMSDAKPAEYSIHKNVISNYDGFMTVIQGNGGTSKLDEDVTNDYIRNLKKEKEYTVFFDKKAQKAAMLTELDNLGFGILEIQDDKSIKIQSIDSKTIQPVYEIALKK